MKSFRTIWRGGYYEGDPLDPMARSTYGELGYVSCLHAQYLGCVKPYVDSASVVCEIGCGRGAWTKTFLQAKEVWCLDVVPAEYSGFWDYIGQRENVRYLQVEDFSCRDLPDDHFTYLFSFGCLCHVPFEGTTEYMQNMYRKLKRGAHAFIMVGDYDKYNRALTNLNKFSVNVRGAPRRIRYLLRAYILAERWWWPTELRNKAEGDHHEPGRWYHTSVEEACRMLERVGYRVVDPDVGFNHRDPVIHFVKP
jgi:SAM-dependent methyltransferase